MGKDTVVTVQSREPTVAEATEDRAPPIRASMDIVQRSPVVINSREYQVLSGKEDGETHVPAYYTARHHNEFSERDLPVVLVSDTTCISEKQQRQVLPTIASVSEPVAIKSAAEDVPNQVADPEAVGREAKAKAARSNQKERPALEEMRDPGVLDLLTRLLHLPDRESFRFGQRALDLIQYGDGGNGGSCGGKQCGGGNGGKSSQTESTANQGAQGGFVTGYTGGRSRLVVGGIGGGGGLGGAGDDDPNDYNPFNGRLPDHYLDFMGFEEQPNSQNDQDRNAAMASVLSLQGPMTNPINPILPQFNDTHEEPMSASLEGSRLLDSDPMLMMEIEPFCDPLMNDAQYLCGQDPMFQVAPAEETAPGAAVMQPVPQPVSDNFPTAEESDIKQSFDLIHLMRPQAQRSRPPQGKVIGITPSGGASIPRSQIQGLNLSVPVPPSPVPTPSPAPSTASFPPTPSPVPPPTPVTPCTPATPQPRGFFKPNTYIDENSRVCELSISPDEIPPEKRNTAIHAMLYINTFYASAFRCAESEMDLKVANDVHAKLCPMHMDWGACSLKVALSMPKECKPLNRWLKTNANPKDHMLILQQVLNTLATIHTLGYEDNLSLWGSFMVWVASDLRVHILVDFPRLLQTQQEYEMYGGRHANPRSYDVAAVKEVYSKVVQPCIGRDGSWVSPALRNVLSSFESFLIDTRSSCRMAEAARMLGEKRVCKVDVDISVPVVFYCLEREELQTALRDLCRLAPRSIAQVWTLRSTSDGSYMRVGDIATADRPMKLTLEPCMHPRDTRLLYIMCN